MRLVVLSNMAHYRRSDGIIVGHGATSRELSAVAALFDEVRHVACLHDEPAPASALPYSADNIELVAVRPTGGPGVRDKLSILSAMPEYVRVMRRELASADAVHVRAPANISLAAILLLQTRATPRRRWVKYAGSWSSHADEPWSYTLQRKLLARTGHGARVTVNGDSGGYAHVVSVPNPSLSDAELRRGADSALAKALASPVRLLFVGHFGAAKHPEVTIDVVAALRSLRVEAQLDLVGEGDADALHERANQLGLANHVTIHGALPRPKIDDLYRVAHFVVLPSRTEGWPKVLGEGMAFGAVPLASGVGSIPLYLREATTGQVFSVPPDPDAYARAIAAYVADPDRWKRDSAHAVAGAATFGYSRYVNTIRALLDV
ncbi:MAG: glycosyltransferase [Kofleriaceae bacterium]